MKHPSLLNSHRLLPVILALPLALQTMLPMPMPMPMPCIARNMDVDMEIGRARQNAQYGHFESVVFNLTRSIKTASGSEKAKLLTARATLRFDHEQYKDALVDLNEAIELAPTMARAYFKKADVLCELNQLQPAIAAIGQYIKLEPTTTSGRYFRGKLYSLSHQLDQAAADFSYCIKYGNAEVAPSHHYLGKVLVEQKKYPEAIKEFTLGLKAGNTPHIHATLLDRSRAYDLIGKHDLAERDRKVLNSSSTDMYAEMMK